MDTTCRNLDKIKRCPFADGDSHLVVENFTLPGLRSHTLRTRVFSSLALLHACTPSSSPGPRPFLTRPRPFLAWPRPALARPSPGPCLALPAPRPALAWPCPPLAHPGLKQSCRQNGQKRNLLLSLSGPNACPTHPALRNMF